MMSYEAGMKYGRLTILREAPRGSNRRVECLCECGKLVVVYTPNLKSGRQQSCGCLRAENAKNRRKERTIVNGYAFVKVPNHPRAHPTTGRVREHILTMEATLGRYLLPGEEVHHLNADRADNRPENLELWNRSQPAGARVSDQIAWATKILAQYAPQRLSTTP